MRRIFAAFLFLLCGSLALAAGSVSYSLDIDITPGNQAGTYLCKAVVTDLETGKVFSAPFVTLVAVSPASTKTADGDLVSEFTVSVDSKTSRATAELKVSCAGKVIAAQEMS